MFKKLWYKLTGDPTQKLIESLQPILDEAESLEPKMEAMSDEELREQTILFKERLAQGETLDDILPEVCAAVREASKRSIGLRHYDVQLMGGTLLHRGEVIEMRTGEGKTLVGTMPLYLNALTGKGVHLVTVNEYLVRRDGGWMGNVFHFLGLTVGCIGPQRFSAIFDPEYVNPGAELEDERLVHWRPCTRKQAYEADITYGTSSEFGFDYLRDNMAKDKEQLVQRGQYYAIIDEVDNVLIDEARTPLIISGPAPRSGKEYSRFAGYVRRLKENTADEEEEANGHYDIDHKSRSISLTDMGIAEIESRIEEIDHEAGESLYDPQYYHLTYYLDNAMKAEYMFKKDKDYVVQNGEVIIVDDFTGRMMPGRRYSDGLHEAIEAKEKVEIQKETITVATITLQNYFRLYEKLGGMTGTAVTDAEEFSEIYNLGVTPLPTNVQYIVDRGEMGLIEKREKDQGTEAISYLDPTTNKPKFYKRTDYPDQVFGTEEAKNAAIVREVKRVHESGRPVLVGTTSVEHSEIIDRMLRQEKIRHQVLNAKMHQSEALVVAQAGRRNAVTISTNMAGRGTDILLGGNAEGLAAETLEKDLFDRRTIGQLTMKLFTDGEAEARKTANNHPKLTEDLVDAIIETKARFDAALVEIEQYQVIGYLARSLQEPYNMTYDELLEIIGMVRGGQAFEARELLEEQNKDSALVEDITRLDGLYRQYKVASEDLNKTADFIAEQVFDVNYNGRSALIRAVLGEEDAEAQKVVDTVPGLTPDWIDRIKAIKLEAEEERRKVWELGGLHVIGSERHESRRIDNQLRGRAARQGDPGSSRFFLSLEDDLMRRFGGERLRRFMDRTSIPDDMPIEAGMLDRMIQSSQERLEGFNFDMRKNVVEYDDVMNLQRQTIYDERRAILLDEADDLDTRIENAFHETIKELVDNYINDYPGYMKGEIERVILEFSTDATDEINLNGVVRQLRGLLRNKVMEIPLEELEGLSAEYLTDRLMVLVHENDEEGHNLYQLLQAMSRFLPIMPAVPALNQLALLKSGQVQRREQWKQTYLEQIRRLFDRLLANELDDADVERLWSEAEKQLAHAFDAFDVNGLSRETAVPRQNQFRRRINHVIRELLLDSLDALDGDQMIHALTEYVQKEQDVWRERIGEEEYKNFQRLLLLNAIDREWRDYLTAMDDLRREIGLSAIAQKDPKVEYKMRSYQMFSDMRKNIDRDLAERFFRQVASHQAFVQQQQQEVAYKLQAQNAGYQTVQRKQGRGAEVRRDQPKVGRNDPCPCGSGQKYKNCHGRAGQSAVVTNGNTGSARPRKPKPKRRK